MAYAYLIGAIICGIAWLFFFLKRKDLRRPMIWSGIAYLVFSSITLLVWFPLSKIIYLGEPIIPSYWNPPELFNFGQLTGFGGIEDVLFIFFIAGLATCIYEFMLHKKIKMKKSYHPHVRALIVSLLSFLIFAYLLDLNLVYILVISYFCGAAAILIERRDLILHSLIGGTSFLIMYVLLFTVFNIFFPSFIQEFYTMHNLSGIMFANIPLEEFLFAFSFGLMWAPIYEYEHGEKTINAPTRN